MLMTVAQINDMRMETLDNKYNAIMPRAKWGGREGRSKPSRNMHASRFETTPSSGYSSGRPSTFSGYGTLSEQF